MDHVRKSVPWSGIEAQSDEFPPDWLLRLLSSNNLLPFAIPQSTRLPRAIVPIKQDSPHELRKNPREDCEAWKRFDDIYQEHRGKGEHTPKTLIDQIDYGRKLTSQLGPAGKERTLVLHPTSGDIMRAARMVPGRAVLDSGIYHYQARVVGEAAYLVGILNAPSLNAAFVESRTSGRHFHKNPWRKVPIPMFDPDNETHRAIAALAVRAEKIAKATLLANPGRGQVAISKRIRLALSEAGVLEQLDDAVRIVLPLHVSHADVGS